MGFLSIAIPTRNRPESIKKTLDNVLDELIKYDVELYLSDNSTDDKTKLLLSQYICPNIHYSRNILPAEYEENIKLVLSNCSHSSYVWLITDGSVLEQGAIKTLITTLVSEPDFLFISRVDNLLPKTDEIIEMKHFLIDHLWHLTKLGTTVFSKEMLLQGLSKITNENSTKDFIQLEILLNSIKCRGLQKVSGKMLSTLIVSQPDGLQSYWKERTMEVWAEKWPLLIEQYGELFDSEQRKKIIKSHAKNTRMLSFKSLFFLRAHNYLSFEQVVQLRMNLKIASTVPVFFIYVLSLFPVSLISMLYSSIKNITYCSKQKNNI